MQHLDEGLLMALLDGELTGAEQLDAETHLRACTECAARFAELKAFMLDADGLVADLGEPPAQTTTPARLAPVARQRRRVLTPRTLAWAASIVAALGLGFAGSQWWLGSAGLDANFAGGASETRAPDTPSRTDGSPPTATQPPVTLQEERASPREGLAALPRDSGPADEIGRPESDSSNRISNEMLALRPNAEEVGQAANRSRDQDAGGLAAAGAATPRSIVETSAKVADLTPGRDTRGERQLAPAAAPMTSSTLRRERVEEPVFQRTTMEEAVRHLSGAIRLVDGLTPEEFEVAAADSAQALVRVIYRVGGAESPLFLEQRRVDNSFMASDLQRSAQVVEPVTHGNKLSWNDLRGFSLTLSGPFSADSLFHFKTLVK